MNRKLTVKEVYKVRLGIAQNISNNQIARELEIEPKLVSKIKLGKRYKNIQAKEIVTLDTEHKTHYKCQNPGKNKRILNKTKVEQVKFLRANTTFNFEQLAIIFKVSTGAISRMYTHGKSQTWKDIETPIALDRSGSRLPDELNKALMYLIKKDLFKGRILALAFDVSTSQISRKKKGEVTRNGRQEGHSV